MAFLPNATGTVRRSGGPSNASMALRMRGTDVDCSRISVRAVRSHNPSRKATVGSVAPSHLAPCPTRWRREGRHRLRSPLDYLGIRRCIALRDHRLYQLDGPLDLLVAHRLDAAGMLSSKISRAQQCQQLAVSCRLVLAHLGNCRWTAVPEVSEQGRNKLAVQLLTVTRADRTAGRVSGPPWFKRHCKLSSMRLL